MVFPELDKYGVPGINGVPGITELGITELPPIKNSREKQN